MKLLKWNGLVFIETLPYQFDIRRWQCVNCNFLFAYLYSQHRLLMFSTKLRNLRSVFWRGEHKWIKLEDKIKFLKVKSQKVQSKRVFCNEQRCSKFILIDIKIMCVFFVILFIFLVFSLNSPLRTAMASKFPTTLKDFGYAFNGKISNIHSFSRFFS